MSVASALDAQLEVTIDGQSVSAHEGETVLQAAKRVGIEIPTLCHDDRLAPAGACRTCLVEVEGQRRLQPACAWMVQDGMQVRTSNQRVKRHRDVLFGMYLADHASQHEQTRSKGNQLSKLAADCEPVALDPVKAPREGRDDRNPYIDFDPVLCILCARCTRYCDEVEGVNAITLSNRGGETTIATIASASLMDTSCELCGGCVDTCPTGALTEKKALQAPKVEAQVRTTCNYCGVGCQMDLNVAQGKVVKVTSPDPGTTLNDGNLCVKGRFAYDFIDHEERITHPWIRDEQGQLQPASWDEAIRKAADGLMGVKKKHGPNSLGFVSSSRCTGEENYLMQKLARAAFGTNNCHQCAAT